MEINAAARLRASFTPSEIDDHKLALTEALNHFHLQHDAVKPATDFPHALRQPFKAHVVGSPAEVAAVLAKALEAEVKTTNLAGLSVTCVHYKAVQVVDHGRMSCLQAFLVLPQDDGNCVVVAVDRMDVKRWAPQLL